MNLESSLSSTESEVGNCNFLFVLGCPHSGTTILHRLIGLHPNIYPIAGESALFCRPGRSKQIGDTLASWSQQARKEGKHWIVEKTPWHSLQIPTIRSEVSDPSFVAILRHPFDVYGSLKKRGETNRITDTLEGRTEVIKQFFEVFVAEADTIPLILLEDFVHDPGHGLGVIFDRLGVASDASVSKLILAKQQEVTDKETAGTVPKGRLDGEEHRALRKWQVRQPIFSNTENRENVNEDERLFILKTLEATLDTLSTKVDLSSWRLA
jgi:hypothetical protein